MEATKETVEIIEPEVKTEPTAKAPERSELKAAGWSARELDAAEKRGMIAKTEEKKPEPKAETPTEPKAEEPKEETPKVEEKPKNGSLPDFTFKTPEQEKVFLDAFGAGTPQRAMYFRMKHERQQRQAVEAERDRMAQEAKLLKERLDALERGQKPQETDEEGNAIDPEDRPLTLKQLREMQKAEAEEYQRKQQEQQSRAAKLAEAQVTQEEYARSLYSDFDDTVKRAQEVIQNLDAVVPEKWRQAKAIKLIRELQTAAANADKLGLDDYNAALIAYEIGQMHPDYGSKNGNSADTDGNLSRPEKANGGHTPEQMKRMEENTQRRASSASIPGGGGRRVVSVDDVSLADLNRMSAEQRQAFKSKHPDRFAKLLRG